MIAKLNFNSKEEILAAMVLPRSVIQDHLLANDSIPKDIWQLTPHASIFGIADDSVRTSLFKTCPAKEIVKLKEDVLQFDDVLDVWLAGPEADSLNPSEAYVCFSALRMGVDTVKAT
ncbi:MAG: Ypar2 [Comamonadaceae bacterium]|nr:MAG: Ypar2 [Comamonadaceae bacterium]